MDKIISIKHYLCVWNFNDLITRFSPESFFSRSPCVIDWNADPSWILMSIRVAPVNLCIKSTWNRRAICFWTWVRLSDRLSASHDGIWADQLRYSLLHNSQRLSKFWEKYAIWSCVEYKTRNENVEIHSLTLFLYAIQVRENLFFSKQAVFTLYTILAYMMFAINQGKFCNA